MDTNALTPTPASSWAGAAQFAGHDLELPSGNVARCRRIAPTAFLASGLIPDPLTDVIRRAIHTKKGFNPADLKDIADDPNKLTAAMELLDRVLVHCLVEPKAVMPPACDMPIDGGTCGEYANTEVHQTPTRSGHHNYSEGLRDPNVLYADVVVMEDKMFVFQWALSGTADLVSFREELQASMDAVSDSDDVSLPTL